MTTYNTGNPLGSVDVRDLYDNAQNTDNFSNGQLDAYPDRFGVSRQSLQGIRNASQYVDLGPYAAGLVFTSRNQVFSYLGEFYAPGPSISLPYTTTGAGAGEIANFRSVGDAVLRQDLAAPGGAALVSSQAPFAGSAAASQDSINSRVCHINDFPSTPASTWLSRAIDGTPDGWTLQLGIGPYQAKLSKARSNIRIVGASKPRVNTGKTALIGGTVIQGTLRLTGSNITIENLGVDCGAPACVLLNGGAAMDALVLNDAARAPLYNCTVKSVVCILKDAPAAAHNFLLEGCVDSEFSDLTSYLGQWGTVLKTERSTARAIKSYGCSQAGLAIKSDTGASGTPCRKTSISDVAIFADGHVCEAGILIYAATYSMDDIALSNYHAEGCNSNIKIVCDSRAANVNLLANLVISNGTLVDGVQLGINTFGAIRNVKIANTVIRNTLSGKSIQVEANCLGLELNGVTASSPTGLNLVDNVYLAGRYTFTDLISCVSDDYGTPAGINCNIESQQASRVGSYIGNLAIAGTYVAVTLTNGWVAYFSTITAKAARERVQLFGRVAVPPTPWTGKAQIGSIPAAIAPLTNKHFSALGYDISGKVTPVTLRVGPAGGIFVDDIATAAAFPATVGWVGLDGVSWILAE